MFVAEQLYTPASLPFKFRKRKIPPEIADWLFSLLHTTIGLGLPVTEH